MASHSRVLYVGMTNDLERRVYEHKTCANPGFVSRYHVTRLVYFEAGVNVNAIITREKQLKAFPRKRKIALIERSNPAWYDLSAGWVQPTSTVE